ncbi:hypothetical protein [Nonomuraea polychroma]|uniref:hypothetical protein n=1 Tax=Nonomuraea polychroma TaxID=46176 RepID=UPI0013E30E4B|nr:hypothetical protein [Nonomuraea polychroma]
MSDCSRFTVASEHSKQAVMIARHPEWDGQEWIGRGAGCLCSERTDHQVTGRDSTP